MQATNALASLHKCAGLSEPSLLVIVTSTELALAGLYYLILFVYTGNRSIQAAYK